MNTTTLKRYTQQTCNFFQNKLQELKAFLVECKRKTQDLTKTNFELGKHHLNRGNLLDAKMRFKMVITMDKSYPEAHYYLGCCYYLNSEIDKASEMFEQAISLGEHKKYAEYRLKLIRNEQIKNIPTGIIREDYDFYASNYNKEYVDKLGYVAHSNLCRFVQDYIDENPKKITKVLDLGCGTGLSGFMLKQTLNPKTIEGGDISANMLDVAKETSTDETPVYSKLYKIDLNDMPGKIKGKFNLITGITSFHYATDLKKLLHNCKKMLSKDGIIAFNVQQSNTDEGPTIDYNHNNFCYSKTYLEQLANQLKFKKFKIEDNDISLSTKGLFVILSN
jgi:predicted TPR repeat methyltransferase